MNKYATDIINNYFTKLTTILESYGWRIVESVNENSIVLIARAKKHYAIRFFAIDSPNITSWLADEEYFGGTGAPLWFSENSHQVSPLFDLKEYLREKDDRSNLWLPIVVLLPSVEIVNPDEMIDSWRDLPVVPFFRFEQALTADDLDSLETDFDDILKNESEELSDTEDETNECSPESNDNEDDEDDEEAAAEVLPTINSLSLNLQDSEGIKGSQNTLSNHFRPIKDSLFVVRIACSGEFPAKSGFELHLKRMNGESICWEDITLTSGEVCEERLLVSDLPSEVYKICITTDEGFEFYRKFVHVVDGAQNYTETIHLEGFALTRIERSDAEDDTYTMSSRPCQSTFNYRDLDGVFAMAIYKNITSVEQQYQFVVTLYNELGQLIFESESSGTMASGEELVPCAVMRKVIRSTGTYTVRIEYFCQMILEAKFVVGQRDINTKFRNKAIEPRGGSVAVVHEVEDPLTELNAMVGLASIKRELTALIAKAKIDRDREKMGLPTKRAPLHMAFLGNPGTGKTTVAKLIGQIYKDVGLLSTGKVVVEERATLCGQNWNTETENTLKAIEASDGGILFIDEAYELVTDHPQDPGKQVLGALMSAMADDSKRNWMVILAGYTKPMERLLSINSGMRSRITPMYFADFDQTELMEVADHWLGRNYYQLTNEARTALEHVVASAYANRDENFGNARYINTLFEKEILPAMAQRILESDAPRDEALLTTIEASDIPNYNLEDNSAKALAKLENMVGLGSLKSSIVDHLSLVRFLNNRRSQGILTTMPPMHMIFTGNPGTGKTSVADYLGEIYRSIGILRVGNVIKVTRADIIDSHVGGTEQKMNNILTAAHGNILFIDEAYTLAKVEGSVDSGYRAIELLLEVLGRENCDFITILAGYAEPMEELLSMNQGIKGRFPYTFHFEDYNESELCEIADGVAAKNNLKLTTGAKRAIEAIVTRECRSKDDNFSNARMVVRLITTKIMPAMARRLEGETDPRKLRTVLKADVPITAEEVKMFNEDLFDEEAITAALQRLDSMVGLNRAKLAIHQFVEFARALNREGDKSIERYPLKWSFVGNTGIGKSSVAEILSELLKAMHLLGKGHTVEVKAEEIYGVNTHQASLLLQKRMRESQQGLLFVDGDAPQFNSPESKYDPEYLRMTLATNTAEIHGHFAVVLAEHSSPRIDLAKSLSQIGINDFDHTIIFDDYTREELLAILEQQLSKHSYTLDGGAKEVMGKYIASLPVTHANARTMKLLARTIQKRARVLGSLSIVSEAIVAPFRVATEHPIAHRNRIGY